MDESRDRGSRSAYNFTLRNERGVTVEIVLFVMCLALIPALIASSKGRSGFGWWIYGCLLLIVAIPHALLAADLNRTPCPKCSEKIMKTASMCPHCRTELSSDTILNRFSGLGLIVERAQREALARVRTGDRLALVIERAEGYPARVRVESQRGPVGYVATHFTALDYPALLTLVERHACDAEVEDVGHARIKVAIRIYRRAPDRPLTLNTAVA
jgi:hypothetical protein